VLFEARCVLCHGGPAPVMGLDLGDETGVLAGSTRGAVVVPGDPEASELIRRLRGTSMPRMPLTGPPYLDDAEMAAVERWIAGLASGAVGEGGDGARPGEAEGADAVEPDAPPEAEPASAGVTFADVRPVLLQHCARCHVANGLMGPAPEGFRVDTYAEVLRSDDRARVVPFAPEASELVRRIRGDARPRMPFDGPPYLSDAEIDLVIAWIDAGAPDVDGVAAPVPVGADVRLHGVWRADGTLDGLAVRLGPDARVEDAAAGAYVQVRGVLEADGGVRVERVRGR
jgi:mono/diheme cytochrome c family protein